MAQEWDFIKVGKIGRVAHITIDRFTVGRWQRRSPRRQIHTVAG